MNKPKPCRGRSYLGVRIEGKIYRLSTFQLDKVLELSGGFLPPFIYEYHFDKASNGEVVPGKRWTLYNTFEPVLHSDGNSLGAFSAEAVMDLSRRAQAAAVAASRGKVRSK